MVKGDIELYYDNTSDIVHYKGYLNDGEMVDNLKQNLGNPLNFKFDKDCVKNKDHKAKGNVEEDDDEEESGNGKNLLENINLNDYQNILDMCRTREKEENED